MQDRDGTCSSRRILLLSSVQTYRAQPFLEAGHALGIRCHLALDMAAELATTGRHGWGFPFEDTLQALDRICALHARTPLSAIIALDDTGALLAAQASARLGLPHNSVEATTAARDKYVMRRKLAAAGLHCPAFAQVTARDSIAETAGRIGFPLVLKPLDRNGSQGVMRVNSAEELETRVPRLQAIIQSDPAASRPTFLMESYVPGDEYAAEALIVDRTLHILAIFDKPDPLTGPFFEESIYVTPSRLPPSVQDAIRDTTFQATQALELGFGPVHAELRINAQGIWIIEVAGRSIGGLCSNTLQFGTGESLEALILRHACGLPIPDLNPQGQARGVMMMPIPEAGIFQGVQGTEQAMTIEGISAIEITARKGYTLKPLPEGNSYLGFIFAQSETPDEVEQALRQAYACLDIQIQPEFELMAD